MSRTNFRRFQSKFAACVALAAALTCGVPLGQAANITWTGGNGSWVDGAGNNANWSPGDEPDADDVAIFNTNNSVTLGSNNSVAGLELSLGIDLNTNGFDLTVAGPTTMSSANTNVFIGGSDSTLAAEDVTVNGGAIELQGGTLSLSEPGLVSAVLTTGAGGDVVGHGTINLDGPLIVSTVLNNNGTLSALARSAIILQPPPVRTLTINGGNASARIDLDGAGESGNVTVQRNQTLDINAQLSDVFNGSLQMFQNTRLEMSALWGLGAGGNLGINNGAQVGIPAIPAGAATIAGAAFNQVGGTITVTDPDGELRFEAPFTMSGGALANNGLVVFDANATIANAASVTMPSTSSSITVAAGREVTINAANFNMDGSNAATNVITVNDDGVLTVNTGDYDTDSATNAFDGTVNLTNATIDIATGDAEFVMDGTLNSSASGANQSLWTGEPLDIGNDAGLLDADVNITGSQPTQFGSQVDFNSDADLNVAGGATAHFLATVNFNSVNGGNNAEFTGSGELIFSDGVNFSETTHLNMAGGTVDLDGADSIGDTINIDAPLTITADLMRSFGKANGGGGVNILDVNNSVNAGALTVNVAGSNAWTLNGPGVMNLVNDNTEATLLAGSEVNVNGTVNVTGDVRIAARVDIAGTVNINTAGQPLRLAGGDGTTNLNRIAGGTISGVGILGADTDKGLRGFGTINSDIDFDGSASLYADDGTLTINGAILDLSLLSVLSDGKAHVTNAWNTSVVGGVSLFGGELSGGAITIDNVLGIGGTGLVSAKVINNTRLRGHSGGTLIFETAGNDNDWDGAGGGRIWADGADIELRDVGPAFAFTGIVEAGAGRRVKANGFALDFNPGSTLNLTEATYESTSSTDIGGTVTIGAGAPSTIEVENNFFLSFETGSTTTLNGDLELKNNNIIVEAGAQFSGPGALRVPDGSNMVGEDGADIDVLLDMQGGFRPGNSEGIGRVEVKDLQLASTSEAYVELIGTSLNAFDRLVVSGDAIVDGFLSIDIDGAFVPALGNTFNIITGNTVTGEFDYYDISGMPAGLTFHLEYLVNAVQLQVVNKPIFTADFDDDGDVDFTDLAIWKGAFDLNQLGDADGDNDSDGNDFVLWQQQLGSTAGVSAVRAVPEPRALALGLAACTMLGAAWRKRAIS